MKMKNVKLMLVTENEMDSARFEKNEGVVVTGTMNEAENEIVLDNGKVLGTFDDCEIDCEVDGEVHAIWAPDDENDDYYIVIE